MEMEFKDTGRRRRLLLIFLGAALALAAAYGAFVIASKGGPAQEVVKKAVLVAARDIPARTAVTATDLTIRQVPIDEALSQSYDSQDAVVGRITSVPIYTDQQITPNLFATSTADADFSILGPNDQVTATSPEWRAVAVQIPAERAVGGEVKAGQHVDLVVSVEFKLLTQNPDGTLGECVSSIASQFQCGRSTKITFQDIEVLKSTPDDEMYVFKMDLHQAEQVSHVIQEAPDSFTMVLRPDEDTRDVDLSQYGTTTDRLIMTYFYPAPQWADLSQLLGPSPYPYPGAPQAPNPGASPIPGGVGTPTGSPAPSGSPEASPAASPAPSATP
jgi:Flp pilus assembly protein CpaB